MKKRNKRKTLRNKCDALWSKLTKIVWKEKYGPLCAWCKTKPFTDSDHIINRGNFPTRWRLENCVCLCKGCHIFRKKREPSEWTQMMLSYVGQDTYDALFKEGHRSDVKQNYEIVYSYLKSQEAPK